MAAATEIHGAGITQAGGRTLFAAPAAETMIQVMQQGRDGSRTPGQDEGGGKPIGQSGPWP
jgi:hypothetical protein